MTSRARVLSLMITATVALAGCDAETIDHVPAESGTDTSEENPEQIFATEVAAAYCSALFACGGLGACDGDPGVAYANEEDCIVYEHSQVEELQVNAVAGGLTFDPACAEQVIIAYSEIGCRNLAATMVQLPELLKLDRLPCQPYVGNVPELDGTCIEVAGTNLSDCQGGLGCLDDSCQSEGYPLTECGCEEGMTCRDRPWDYGECRDILAVGEQCAGGEPSDDGPLGYCDATSYCNLQPAPDGTVMGTCVARVALGAACERDDQCDSQLCQGGTCVVGSPTICDYAPRHWRSN